MWCVEVIHFGSNKTRCYRKRINSVLGWHTPTCVYHPEIDGFFFFFLFSVFITSHDKLFYSSYTTVGSQEKGKHICWQKPKCVHLCMHSNHDNHWRKESMWFGQKVIWAVATTNMPVGYFLIIFPSHDWQEGENAGRDSQCPCNPSWVWGMIFSGWATCAMRDPPWLSRENKNEIKKVFKKINKIKTSTANYQRLCFWYSAKIPIGPIDFRKCESFAGCRFEEYKGRFKDI